MPICEACRATSATREVEAGTAPFLVCKACCNRLEARALRPLEWFNLASLHGPYQFLLHDDFYDGATACMPTIPVEAPERFPVPALDEMEGNADRLLDYAATRHFLWEETEPALVAALRRLEPATLFGRLQHRFATAKDEHVEYICIVVCGHAVGSLAELWIEQRYADPMAPRFLGALAYAGSRCVAEARGFDLAARALASIATNLAQTAFGSLGWFRSPRSLDWIERAVQPPLVETWGSLAAVSRPPWERLAAWLAGGRPLSLVALDALVEIGKGRALGFQGGSPMVRWLRPELVAPPSREVATSTLEAYVATDDSPRARRAVRAILRNWDLIAGGTPAEWVRE
jgi:hypothetical protein